MYPAPGHVVRGARGSAALRSIYRHQHTLSTSSVAAQRRLAMARVSTVRVHSGYSIDAKRPYRVRFHTVFNIIVDVVGVGTIPLYIVRCSWYHLRVEKVACPCRRPPPLPVNCPSAPNVEEQTRSMVFCYEASLQCLPTTLVLDVCPCGRSVYTRP